MLLEFFEEIVIVFLQHNLQNLEGHHFQNTVESLILFYHQTPKYMSHMHSSEIRGLCLMKCSSKMLQNLPYFWNTKTHVVFLFFISCYVLYFFYNECPGLCEHRPQADIQSFGGKNKVAQTENWKKKLGFLYSKNMANFEAFS